MALPLVVMQCIACSYTTKAMKLHECLADLLAHGRATHPEHALVEYRVAPHRDQPSR